MTHSTKEVVHYSIHGIEVLQPGLEPVYPQYANYGHPSHIEDKRNFAAPSERRLCGVRKITFWLVFTVAALALIAVGVPVGLEVGRSRSQPPVDTAGERQFWDLDELESDIMHLVSLETKRYRAYHNYCSCTVGNSIINI